MKIIRPVVTCKQPLTSDNNLNEINFIINNITAEAEQINIAVNKAKSLCSKSHEHIENMMKELSWFKVE